MADEVEYDVEAEAGGQTVSNGYAEEAESASVQAAASVAESDDDEELRRMKRRERFALESAAGKDAEAAKGKGSRRERDAPARSARDAPARGPAPEIEGSEIIGRFRRCFRCNKRFGAHDVSSFQCHKCGDHPVPRADNPSGQGAEAADGGERPPPTSLDEKLPKCYNCGGEGHLRRNCPEPRRKNDGREGDAAAADAGEEGQGEEGGRKRRRGEREAPSKAPVQVEGSALIQVNGQPCRVCNQCRKAFLPNDVDSFLKHNCSKQLRIEADRRAGADRAQRQTQAGRPDSRGLHGGAAFPPATCIPGVVPGGEARGEARPQTQDWQSRSVPSAGQQAGLHPTHYASRMQLPPQAWGCHDGRAAYGRGMPAAGGTQYPGGGGGSHPQYPGGGGGGHPQYPGGPAGGYTGGGPHMGAPMAGRPGPYPPYPPGPRPPPGPHPSSLARPPFPSAPFAYGNGGYPPLTPKSFTPQPLPPEPVARQPLPPQPLPPLRLGQLTLVVCLVPAAAAAAAAFAASLPVFRRYRISVELGGPAPEEAPFTEWVWSGSAGWAWTVAE